MYRELKPKPNSRHQLSIWLSLRGESSLESFHDNLANFANSGMGASLADILNLMGTARYNFAIRHKLQIAAKRQEERQTNMPVGWETAVPHWNHSELAHINCLAASMNVDAPFRGVETLPKDNGERFFSEYLDDRKQIVGSIKEHNQSGRCPCLRCENNPIPLEGVSNNPTSPLVLMINKKQPPPEQQKEKEKEKEKQLTSPPPVTSPSPPAHVPWSPPAHVSPPPPAYVPPQHQQLFTPYYQQWPMNNFAFMAPPPPPQQQQHCCNRCAIWKQTNTRGRHPHDLTCPKYKIKKNEKNI